MSPNPARVPYTVVVAVPARIAVGEGEYYLAWVYGHGRDVVAQRAQAVREAIQDFGEAYGLAADVAKFATAALVLAGHHRDVADSLGVKKQA